MHIVQGNMWDYHAQGHPVVITTNTVVKKNGLAVMGAGVALQAAKRFPNLPLEQARVIKEHGARVAWYPNYNIYTFPTKYDWRNPSDLTLIQLSAISLREAVKNHGHMRVYMPPPGCGHGGLTWDVVQPILEKMFGDTTDRFYVFA